MKRFRVPKGIERRVFSLSELRTEGEGDTRKVKGYAAVIDKLSEDLGGFREKVAAGAFTKTLQEADVRALFNHDANFVLGRRKSGTLSLAEDRNGLAFEATPPDTQWARDLMVSVDRGDIDQMSFAFRTIKDQWADQDKPLATRTLLEVQLLDVSIVTFPAYPQTTVAVRSLLIDADIDLEVLSGVLGRSIAGLSLRGAEKDLVTRAIEALHEYMPDEPGQESHSTDDETQRSSEEPGQESHSGADHEDPEYQRRTRELRDLIELGEMEMAH